MKEVRNYLNDLNSMFRYLCALNPILFLEIIGIVTIDALLPYINVVSVQLIVDELLLSKQSEKIKYIVVVTIIANIIFRMILGLLKKSRETEQITTARADQFRTGCYRFYRTLFRKVTSRGLSGWENSSWEGLSSPMTPPSRKMVRLLTSRAKRIS